MFLFNRNQKIFSIGETKLGGKPGQLPTVMIGSIFYHGDKLVEDEKKGVFNKEKALELLNKEDEISKITGNPRIVDVCGAWPNALVRFIDFIADATESPFLIDGPTADVRIEAVKHVGEVGLADRAIYNSITIDIKPEEIEAIKEANLKSAILLTINSKKPTIIGRMETLRGSSEVPSLLELAKECGVENMLIDTTILDVPDPGLVAKTIYLVKSEFGLPAGCGPHNAIDRWISGKRLDRESRMVSSFIANVIPIIMGANFILYGPIKNAPKIYPVCSLVDAYVAYSMKQEYGVNPLTREHPLYKIFHSFKVTLA